jgi:Ca2+-binding RTX toxin-like protein
VIVVAGSEDANTVDGGRRGDTLFGAGGDDVLRGGGGADVIIGGKGSDYLAGQSGDDRIFFDAKDSFVSGGNGNDTLVLDTGAVVDLSQRSGTQIANQSVFSFENLDASAATSGIVVTGTKGANVLIGGSVNDQLIGGGGADTLTGNGGADRFIFQDSAISDARTTITDFSRGQGDRIDLSLIDAKEGGRDNAFTFIGSAAFTGTAGELRAVSSAGSQLISGDVDGDGVADFSILVQNTGPIVASDLLL